MQTTDRAVGILEVPLEKVNAALGLPRSGSVDSARIQIVPYRVDAYAVEVDFVDGVSAQATFSRADDKPLLVSDALSLLASVRGGGGRVWTKLADSSWTSDDECNAVLTPEGTLQLTSPLVRRLRLIAIKESPGTEGAAAKRLFALHAKREAEHQAEMNGGATLTLPAKSSTGNVAKSLSH